MFLEMRQPDLAKSYPPLGGVIGKYIISKDKCQKCRIIFIYGLRLGWVRSTGSVGNGEIHLYWITQAGPLKGYTNVYLSGIYRAALGLQMIFYDVQRHTGEF